MTEARWLDRRDLAAHVGLSEAALRRRLRDGTLPPPAGGFGPRSPRWWSPDVDAALRGAARSPGATLAGLADEIDAHEGRPAPARNGRGQGIPLSSARSTTSGWGRK